MKKIFLLLALLIFASQFTVTQAAIVTGTSRILIYRAPNSAPFQQLFTGTTLSYNQKCYFVYDMVNGYGCAVSFFKRSGVKGYNIGSTLYYNAAINAGSPDHKRTYLSRATAQRCFSLTGAPKQVTISSTGTKVVFAKALSYKFDSSKSYLSARYAVRLKFDATQSAASNDANDDFDAAVSRVITLLESKGYTSQPL